MPILPIYVPIWTGRFAWQSGSAIIRHIDARSLKEIPGDYADMEDSGNERIKVGKAEAESCGQGLIIAG